MPYINYIKRDHKHQTMGSACNDNCKTYKGRQYNENLDRQLTLK